MAEIGVLHLVRRNNLCILNSFSRILDRDRLDLTARLLARGIRRRWRGSPAAT